MILRVNGTEQEAVGLRRRTLGLLFGILFLVMVGFSVLFPVEPLYIQLFGATAKTMGWIVAVYSVMQFIFSPFWGRLSDRVGRKPVLMVGLFGFAVAMTFFGLARNIPELFLARALGGILSSATLPTAMAVVADVTDEEDRAAGMGILGAAFGLGVIFGPGLGGLLAAHYTLNTPYFVTAGMALLMLGVVALVLPESLPPEKRQAARPRRSRWAALTPATAPLYTLAFVVAFALAGLETTFAFLGSDRFGLDSIGLGLVFMVMALTMAVVQGLLVGPIKKRVGEERMMFAGLLVSGSGMALIAAAGSVAAVTAGLSIFALGNSLIRPANTALITRRTEVGQGEATGLLGSMDSLGRIGGPVVGGTLYQVAYSLPFISGALLHGLAFGIFLWYMRGLARRGGTGEAAHAGGGREAHEEGSA